MYWNACPARIADYNADMRWIVILRNPTERAHSHWVMESRRGRDALDFGEALRAEGLRLSESGGQHRHWSYLDRGRYSHQIDRLFGMFGRDHVLVLLNEDLEHNHDLTMSQVWDFIGVDHVSVTAQRLFEQTYPDMDDTDREWMSSMFSDEIDRLEVTLDRSLASWRR